MMKQEVLVNSELEIEIKCELYHSPLKTSTYLPMVSFLIIRDLVKYYTADEDVEFDIKIIGGKKFISRKENDQKSQFKLHGWI